VSTLDIFTYDYFVLSGCTPLTDRQMERQTSTATARSNRVRCALRIITNLTVHCRQRLQLRVSTEQIVELVISADTLHYIRTIQSDLSNSSFKDHYGKAVKKQCLGMIAGISVFSVSDEMLRVMEQTGRQQVDCSRDAGQQQQMSDRR